MSKQVADDEAMVAAFVEEARRRTEGGGVGLGEALFEEGVTARDGGPVTETAISNWCQGVSRPTAATLLAIARASGLSLDMAAGLYGPACLDDAGSTKVSLLREQIQEVAQEMARLQGQPAARRVGG